jgi:prepilin-type N-terminal cleavage/methylation domain-containing protein
MARQATDRGFTLIELMIVVVIIGVLATIAGTAYRRYMDSGRSSEAMAVLGEIRAKEEAYRAEFNAYAGWSAGSELPSKSLPAVDNTTCATGGSKEPCYKTIPAAPLSAASPWPVWGGLGISPGKSQLQCGYIVNSGSGTVASPQTVTGTLGSQIIGSSQTTPWWYAIAMCDNDGDGSSSSIATFTTGWNTTVVSAQNEHK